MKTLIHLCALGVLLSSCATSPPVTGQFSGKAGQIIVHPDGRFEIVVEPRTSK